MLCTTESHKSMQCPGIVDIITAEASGGWWGRALRVAGQALLDLRLHSPHALFTMFTLCHPRLKKLSHTCHSRNYITAFHLASCLSRTRIYALLAWTMGCAAYWMHTTEWAVCGTQHPKKTSDNNEKHTVGGVGSVVANHHGDGANSVIITTLNHRLQCCSKLVMQLHSASLKQH